jgi:aminoglycoside 3'-phosphotransferase-2
LHDEAERTAWLDSRGIRVPRTLREHDEAGSFAVLMSAVPGASPGDGAQDPSQVVPRLAAALAALHRLPAESCPFDETLAVRLARAQQDVARDGINGDDFDARNAGVTPADLLRRLAATMPKSEDLVVIHGDATFDNIRADADGSVGFIDCGRAGRADRYVDLCLVGAEIEEHFGADWLTPFVRAYGLRSWDDGKARWFSDLYELF